MCAVEVVAAIIGVAIVVVLVGGSRCVAVTVEDR